MILRISICTYAVTQAGEAHAGVFYLHVRLPEYWCRHSGRRDSRGFHCGIAGAMKLTVTPGPSDCLARLIRWQGLVFTALKAIDGFIIVLLRRKSKRTHTAFHIWKRWKRLPLQRSRPTPPSVLVHQAIFAGGGCPATSLALTGEHTFGCCAAAMQTRDPI